jgi:hypothetical protein
LQANRDLIRGVEQQISSATLTNNAMAARVAGDNLRSTQAVPKASSINATSRSPADDSHMVKLSEPAGPTVKFVVMPEVYESRNVEYEAVAPPQSPGAFQKYKGTAPTQWTVNATLICRTTDEATRNLEIINILRGWTMPFFGENTRVTWPTKLGAPPPVLEFSGFRQQMVGPVQVVMTSLQWTFPQGVDYIPARGFKHSSYGLTVPSTELIPFPTVLKLNISLVESWSTDQFNGFDLAAFRAGQFRDAFRSMPGSGISELSAASSQAGIIQPDEAAQKPPQPTFSVGGGRGTQGFGGPTAEEIAAYNVDYGNRQATKASARRGGTIAELRRAAYVAQDPNRFKSGGGGDFGGGGASGDT